MLALALLLGTITAADLPKDAPRFEDYPATVYKGRRTSPLIAGKYDRLFRTMIRKGAAEGPNFAGRYTLISWGCGAGCAAWVVADARTGRVAWPANLSTTQIDDVDPALEDPDQFLVTFRRNSRLVRVIGGVNEDPRRRGISWFVWDGRAMKRVRFVPKP